MPISPEDVREKLEAGRRVVAERLRVLADDLETLPLQGAAEVLSWIGDQVERVLREAERVVGAQRGGDH